MNSQPNPCSDRPCTELQARLDLLCDVALDINGAWSDLEPGLAGGDLPPMAVAELRDSLHSTTRQIHALRDRVRQHMRGMS